MDLTNFFSVPGKAGLFQLVTYTRNGAIVESLLDGKRIPIGGGSKPSSLEEICMYTDEEDKPLKEIFDTIFEKENGGLAIDSKEDPKKLAAYFAEIVPNYDRARVYPSDMKKLFAWYNLLQTKGLLKKEEETKVTGDD